MLKLFAAFPAGWPGIGLICLRIAVAMALLTHGVRVLSAAPAFLVWTIESFALLVGVALLIGFLTPLVGAAAAIGYLYMGASQFLATGANSHGSAAWCLAVISIALVLLGPGAFSLDARLFGLREIVIPVKGR